MLGFEPIATMPMAGSPLMTGAANILFVCEGGEYTISGATASLVRSAVLIAGAGGYTIVWPDAFLGRQRDMHLDGGVYQITGQDARIYQSSYFYGDPEIIRVTTEVTSMRIPSEPRDMRSMRGPEDNVVDEDNDTEAEPRLRRT